MTARQREMDLLGNAIVDALYPLVYDRADDDVVEVDAAMRTIANKLGVPYGIEVLPAVRVADLRNSLRSIKASIAANGMPA